MVIAYPGQKYGRFTLGLAVNPGFLEEHVGFVTDKKFFRDPDYHTKSIMAIDRAVWEKFKDVGLGYENPVPRPYIEPHGHRWGPAMYGCEIIFHPASEPWAQEIDVTDDELDELVSDPWTIEKFANAEPNRLVMEQAKYLRSKYPDANIATMQGIGSVINCGHSVLGSKLLEMYMTNPDLLRKFYHHMTDMTFTCMEYFSKYDNQPLGSAGLGNCSVAMIGPEQYMACNWEVDQRVMNWAKERNFPFSLHQDSDVNPHIDNYGKFGYVHHLDFGQDTDYERLYKYYPDATINVLLWPSWALAVDDDEMRADLMRWMRTGVKYKKGCYFSIYDVDQLMGRGRLFQFVDIFRQCAEQIEKEQA